MSADRDQADHRCRNDHRLLFRKTKDGIVLRCRTCKQDQVITWAMLAAMQAEQTSPAVNNLT